MQDLEPAMRCIGLMRFEHGIGGAFDGTLHPQGSQQMPHQGGLARPQFTLQGNPALIKVSDAREALGHGLGIGFTQPLVDSYNRTSQGR